MKVLVFTAEWCGPCRNMKPIVKAIDDETQSVEFQYVDVDEEKELAIKYSVRSVPVLVMVDEKGYEVGRKTGPQTRAVLDMWVKQPELF